MAETPKNIITPQTTALPEKPVKKKETSYYIQTVFKKTIEVDELSILSQEKKDTQRKPEDVVSLQFPLIKINDYIFTQSEIRSVSIDCTEFLPKITINVMMISQLFVAKEMPKDGDLISIAIRNKTDALKIIRADFVITGVHSLPHSTDTSKSPSLLTFYGELFVPGLKSQVGDFSFEGTSYYALQDYAKKIGLGFASNDDDTNDKQIWMKANMAGDIYIQSVAERAWRDDQSFYKCWIDLYYNLNFVNMNKQLMSAESEVDIAAMVSNFDKEWNYGVESEQEKTDIAVKVFSNFPAFKTTSFFIHTWKPLNRASSITFQIGTKMVCELFEHNRFLYEDAGKQKYWAVPVEPTYDPDKSDKMILLRGRASQVKQPDESGTSTTPEQKRANYPYVDLYQKFPWLGIQYTISNPNDDNLQWDGNHHKNYQVAKVKNLINNKELDKLNLHLEVIGNNFNVINGDKIPVALIRIDTTDNMKINPDSNMKDSLDLFYSGWYIVKGFTLNWSGADEGDVMSGFTQEFILTRREWPAPVPVEPIKKTTENK